MVATIRTSYTLSLTFLLVNDQATGLCAKATLTSNTDRERKNSFFMRYLVCCKFLLLMFVKMLKVRTACYSAANSGTDANNISKIERPSVLPSAVEQALSGCGIMPNTVRSSLQMQAILRTDP